MFGTILITIMKQIGWTSLIKAVWNLADDSIKTQVIKSENKVDDLAFKIVDEFIKEL